jgi:hypothetical protein
LKVEAFPISTISNSDYFFSTTVNLDLAYNFYYLNKQASCVSVHKECNRGGGLGGSCLQIPAIPKSEAGGL